MRVTPSSATSSKTPKPWTRWTRSPSRCCKTSSSPCWPPCLSARPALFDCVLASPMASHTQGTRLAASTGSPGSGSDRSRTRRWPSCATPPAPRRSATTSTNNETPPQDQLTKHHEYPRGDEDSRDRLTRDPLGHPPMAQFAAASTRCQRRASATRGYFVAAKVWRQRACKVKPGAVLLAYSRRAAL